MKKILLIFSLLFLGTMSMNAQKIKLISGSLDFLKEETIINGKFTYDGLKVLKETEADYTSRKVAEMNAKEAGKGDTWLKSWNKDKSSRFENQFAVLFNKYMAEKGPRLDSKGGKYTMVINTTYIDPGMNIGLARKNASVDITITFLDDKNSEVAIITIKKSSADDITGGLDFDSAYRIQESFGKAGRELAKFLIKKAKLK